MTTELSCMKIHNIDCGFDRENNCCEACPGYQWNGMDAVSVPKKPLIKSTIDDVGQTAEEPVKPKGMK